jgi:hypothetical protein
MLGHLLTVNIYLQGSHLHTTRTSSCGPWGSNCVRPPALRLQRRLELHHAAVANVGSLWRRLLPLALFGSCHCPVASLRDSWRIRFAYCWQCLAGDDSLDPPLRTAPMPQTQPVLPYRQMPACLNARQPSSSADAACSLNGLKDCGSATAALRSVRCSYALRGWPGPYYSWPLGLHLAASCADGIFNPPLDVRVRLADTHQPSSSIINPNSARLTCVGNALPAYAELSTTYLTFRLGADDIPHSS